MLLVLESDFSIWTFRPRLAPSARCFRHWIIFRALRQAVVEDLEGHQDQRARGKSSALAARNVNLARLDYLPRAGLSFGPR